MQRKWGIRKIAEFFRFQGSGHQHDCKATLEKVMLALDNELSEQEEKKLLDELNCCSHCLEKYEIEKSFKAYLCDKLRRHTANFTIAEQIRIRIHNADHESNS